VFDLDSVAMKLIE
jgi:hypothetical protein